MQRVRLEKRGIRGDVIALEFEQNWMSRAARGEVESAGWNASRLSVDAEKADGDVVAGLGVGMGGNNAWNRRLVWSGPINENNLAHALYSAPCGERLGEGTLAAGARRDDGDERGCCCCCCCGGGCLLYTSDAADD